MKVSKLIKRDFKDLYRVYNKRRSQKLRERFSSGKFLVSTSLLKLLVSVFTFKNLDFVYCTLPNLPNPFKVISKWNNHMNFLRLPTTKTCCLLNLLTIFVLMVKFTKAQKITSFGHMHARKRIYLYLFTGLRV